MDLQSFGCSLGRPNSILNLSEAFRLTEIVTGKEVSGRLQQQVITSNETNLGSVDWGDSTPSSLNWDVLGILKMEGIHTSYGVFTLLSGRPTFKLKWLQIFRAHWDGWWLTERLPVDFFSDAASRGSPVW